MKTNFILVLLVALAFGCKKNKDVNGCMDAQASNYNAQATVDDGSCQYPDPTCAGHPTNTSMFPLIQGAKWEYTMQGASQQPSLTVVGTFNHSSLTYFKLIYNELGVNHNKYYRADANGDIYEYNENINAVSLLVPNNPSVGQTWAYNVSSTREVVDINASLNTPTCNYTGCVVIKETNSFGVSRNHTYKRGIGFITVPGIGGRTLKKFTF